MKKGVSEEVRIDLGDIDYSLLAFPQFSSSPRAALTSRRKKREKKKDFTFSSMIQF